MYRCMYGHTSPSVAFPLLMNCHICLCCCGQLGNSPCMNVHGLGLVGHSPMYCHAREKPSCPTCILCVLWSATSPTSKYIAPNVLLKRIKKVQWAWQTEHVLGACIPLKHFTSSVTMYLVKQASPPPNQSLLALLLEFLISWRHLQSQHSDPVTASHQCHEHASLQQPATHNAIVRN